MLSTDSSVGGTAGAANLPSGTGAVVTGDSLVIRRGVQSLMNGGYVGDTGIKIFVTRSWSRRRSRYRSQSVVAGRDCRQC